MTQAAGPRGKASRQKNLFLLVVLSLIGVAFYYLTLVRMGEQPAFDKRSVPSATPSSH